MRARYPTSVTPAEMADAGAVLANVRQDNPHAIVDEGSVTTRCSRCGTACWCDGATARAFASVLPVLCYDPDPLERSCMGLWLAVWGAFSAWLDAAVTPPA
jgi:hypothetical protein